MLANALGLLSLALIGQLTISIIAVAVNAERRQPLVALALFHLTIAGYLLFPLIFTDLRAYIAVPVRLIGAFQSCGGLIIYLFYRSFEGDPFLSRRQVWAIAVVTVSISLLFHVFDLVIPGAKPVVLVLKDMDELLIQIPLVALTLFNIWRDYRSDLLERSRRARLIFLGVIGGAFIVLYGVHAGLTAFDVLTGRYFALDRFGIQYIVFFGLCWLFAALYALGVTPFLVTRIGQRIFDRTPDRPEPVAQAADALDPDRLALLTQLMEQEKVYRDARLTMGALAAQMELAEKELRALINQGLGFRNFNHFLNSYRLAEAQQWLADPARARLPILTIALDLGFGSAASFNRVFKAATDQTPTDFREAMLGNRSRHELASPIVA